MELVAKSFYQLTNDELLDIFKARVAVFVVEQRCPYQEIDEADRAAIHVFLRDQDGLQAYLRALPPGQTFPDASIGRVLTLRRGEGLGGRLLAEGIRVAREAFGADQITIEAQTYARGFYEKAGFVQVSEAFLEDGIPHIQMRLRL